MTKMLWAFLCGMLASYSVAAYQYPNTNHDQIQSVYQTQSPKVLAAMQAMSEAQYPKALSLYHQAFSDNANDKAAVIGIIWANLMLRKYDISAKWLTKYRKKFGIDEAYTIEKARYFALTNQKSKAIRLVKPLLEKEPANDILLDIYEYASSR